MNLSLGLAALVATSPAAQSQIVADLPDLQLLPNTPGQTFTLELVNNSGAAVPVNGLLMSLQVADGGPEGGGTIDGPAVTSLDVVTGTVFESNHNPPLDLFVYPQVRQGSVSTVSGTVNLPTGPNQYATVTFDTTGFFSGVFSYTLDTINTDMFYTTTDNPISVTVLDGQLTVVPEPSTYAFIAGLSCLAFGAWRRKQR